MTLTGTISTGLHLFAAVLFSREHRHPGAGVVYARSQSGSDQATMIQPLDMGSRGVSPLTMRWSADATSLSAVWGGREHDA